MRPAASLLLLAAAARATLPPTAPPFVHPRGQLADRGVTGAFRSIEDYGARAGDGGDAAANAAAISRALASLAPGDALVVPANRTYHVVGGIAASGLRNATILVDGELFFDFDLVAWPRAFRGRYLNGLTISESIDVVLSSRARGGRGRLDGNGVRWWNHDIAGLLPDGDSRPRLVQLANNSDVLVERLELVNSPSWHLELSAVRAEVRDVTVVTDRARERVSPRLPSNGTLIPSALLQPEDLNTDGIDPSGRAIWIHDCAISNDDDSIAVKPSRRGTVNVDGTAYDCTGDVLVERVELVGFGASIGSVGPTDDRACVDGVTMRDVAMPGTGKGIYVKSNGDDCRGDESSQISNLLFENFTISRPWWFAVWIGPQQQHEPHTDLGLDCALAYPLGGTRCPTQACVDFENIVLRDVRVDAPYLSPGALLGNASNPMRGVVFDRVVVRGGGGRFPWREAAYPWRGTYQSEFVGGVCVECDPVPPGFEVLSRAEYDARRGARLTP